MNDLTHYYADSADGLRRRAYKLPGKYRSAIPITSTGGDTVFSKYRFESEDPIGEGGTSVVVELPKLAQCLC